MITIALTSGKGGVGKTSISANLAAAMQRSGLRTVVFDADLQLANLDIILGVDPEYNLQHVVAGEKSLREIMVEGPGGVRAITGASAVPTLMAAGPKRMGTFLTQFSHLERDTDVLLFDTGAGLDNRVITFLKLAQETIIVVTPDPTSVTDAYATIKTLKRRDKGCRIRLLFNMTNEIEARNLFDTIEQVAWTFLQQKVEFLGNVRHDPQVVRSARTRKLFVLEAPECKAAQDIKHIASKIHQLADHTSLKVS